jgi:23S rRNA pseudouridine2604 synthase
MRVNKFVVSTGYCSRREADRLIQSGRITINNEICQLGSQVNEGDVVCIDGQPINSTDNLIYLALNKPVGITCTADPLVKSNIIDFVNHPERIFPIGRLDRDSEGLILLTNDGDIVNKILRSENSHDKEYIVTVDRPVTDDFIYSMSNGVEILDTITNKCKISRVDNYMFRIILTQGMNRQIRRMCKVFGYKVLKLERIRIMNITLRNLPIGHWRDLTPEELKTIKSKIK